VILISNVGKRDDIAILYWGASGKEVDEIIMINANGTLKATQILAPGRADIDHGLFRRFASYSLFGHLLRLEDFPATLVHRSRRRAQS